ncbi:MAG: GrpB family protein [Gemmatimonadota bacterium]|nr:GrpB family protein [Gemmatimonadota bacterium]
MLTGNPQAIELVPYDPRWPRIFDSESGRIRSSLGSLALSLEHVGSTSVPGLIAKPIIDICLVVLDSSREDAYLAKLEDIGYAVSVREPEWFEHRMLQRTAPEVNLHIFSADCAEVARMRLFRDWLRGAPEDVRLYAETKPRLAKRTWASVQEHADAKSDIVAEISTRAEAGVRGAG